LEITNNIIKGRSDVVAPINLQSLLIGRPLATADAPNQTIGKLVGLAVFASDALSSTAYASQEILFILAAAGSMALGFAFPIAIAIVVLMTIVTISYEQTIHAYPGGGGAYIVARDNLGELPAQTAGAALLTDYILTVSVSISSGVAQIVSAFPGLFAYRVWIAVGLVVFIMVVNLKGVKESGYIFAIPVYFFVGATLLTVILGFSKYLMGGLGTVINPPELLHNSGIIAITPFLILHAFSSGTSALTGIEAISNGITAFKEPRSKNAGITLIIMSSILGVLFLGITFLAGKIGAVPSEIETVISQFARTVYGGENFMYLAIIAGTAIILVLAANTAFADFPRLGALHAGDGFLPRQMTYRGSRLVYSWGIISLAVISSILIIIFQASVTRMIPLYAIGVFLSFTLSQSGMAKRWWKSGHLKQDEIVHEPGSVLKFDRQWVVKMIVNGFGAVCTAVVMIVFAVTKFKDGAWAVVILTPLLVTGFFTIHRHYKKLAKQLSLDQPHKQSQIRRNHVIMPIGGVHQGTIRALKYAQKLGDDITAIHISIDPVEEEKIKKKWDIWGEGYRLVVLDSPYRLFIEPLIEYISKLEQSMRQGDVITIVIPQFISKTRTSDFLHSRTSEMLRKVLLSREEIVIVEVPYVVE
jgi:amino acid transporter